jgi:transcription antitermination factor NusG
VFETVHIWRNRQKKKIVRPLFPSYVFVHVSKSERRFVYSAPGVVRLVGGMRGPIPIPDVEIEDLRSASSRSCLEPVDDLVVGERVRIASGPMRGMAGTLMRRKSALRFILSVSLINRHVALEIGAEDIEPLG